MLEAMLPYAGAVFTVTPDNPRAMKAEELASEAEAIVARLWKERAGKPEKVQGTENSPQGAGGMEPLPKVSACIWLLILSQRDQADHAVGLIDKSVHRNAVSYVDHIISVSVKKEKRWIKRKYKRA